MGRVLERLHLSLCFVEGGAGSGVTRAMLRLFIYLMDSRCFLCFQDMLRVAICHSPTWEAREEQVWLGQLTLSLRFPSCKMAMPTSSLNDIWKTL